jgi:hypothetical protein
VQTNEVSAGIHSQSSRLTFFHWTPESPPTFGVQQFNLHGAIAKPSVGHAEDTLKKRQRLQMQFNVLHATPNRESLLDSEVTHQHRLEPVVPFGQLLYDETAVILDFSEKDMVIR